MSVKSPGLGAGGLASLTNYETSTFTASLTGCTTVPTGTVQYTLAGNIVTLSFPFIEGTSNTTAATLTGLPAKLTPATAKRCVGMVEDNSAVIFGRMEIGTDSVITLRAGPGTTAFTAANLKGMSVCSVSYSLG